MLHSFSFGELALIFGIIIVLFGGSRLASVGKSLGEGIANFKKGLNSASVEEKEKPKSFEAPPAISQSTPPQVASSLSSTNTRPQVVDVVESKESSAHFHS